MRISTQTEFYLHNGLSPREAVDAVIDAEFDCVDFSFFKVKEDKLINDKNLNEEFRSLREHAESRGVVFNQAHAPFPSSVGEEKRDREIFESIVRSMELASILGVKNIIVHPKQHLAYLGNEEALKEINYEFYMSLLPYCEKYKIHVAIENMWQCDSVHEHIIASTCGNVDEHVQYIDMMKSEWFIACLDVGHCALTGGNIGESVKALGHDRLKALHVHDVDYVHDLHTLPGVSKLDFTQLASALREIDYDGEMTLEADMFLKGFEKEFWNTAAHFMAERARFIADMASK